MITIDELREYYASLGITLPDSILQCIVEKVNSVYQCMIDNGYTECDIKLALLLSAGLIGISMGARMVSSQTASKVSQSYSYRSLSELQDILINNLKIYDPENCTGIIIPSKQNQSFAFVSTPCKG